MICTRCGRPKMRLKWEPKQDLCALCRWGITLGALPLPDVCPKCERVISKAVTEHRCPPMPESS